VSDFTAILHETQAAIRLHIAARGIPLSEVDDIAQEVYLDFYKAQDQRPPEVEPIRWLKGIARNHCLRWFRAHARPGTFLAQLDEALEPVASGLEDDGSGDPLLIALRRCLGKLPERSRRLLEDYYGDDEGVDRASSGVRMAVLRLREALRQCVLGQARA
jgi:RNA polymerase sigma factor (sigma-70 family)